MPTLERQSTLPASIDLVWAYLQNVQKSLPALVPPHLQLEVEFAEMPLQNGSKVAVSFNLPPAGRRVRMVTAYGEFRPPKAVIFGQEAWWVDQQVEGPFAFYAHRHELESIDSRTTRVVDRITYRTGIAGLVLSPLLARPQLKRLLIHRHRVLAEVFPPSKDPLTATRSARGCSNV